MTNKSIIDNPITNQYNEVKGLSKFIASLYGDIFDLVVNSNNKETELEKKFYEFEDENDLLDISKRKWVFDSFKYEKYFSQTQKWIGHIVEIQESTFIAKLEDLTLGGTSEIGEFEMNEVTPDDRKLIAIGATFYWSVGYSIEKDGQRNKTSLIRFQRVLRWEENYINSAADRANRLLKNLKWE